MNIGRLHKIINVTPVSYTDDGMGGSIETEGTPFEVWASMRSMSQKEVLEHGLIKGDLYLYITIRYDLDQTIDRSFKFDYEGRKLNANPLRNRLLGDNELTFTAHVRDY